MAKKNSDFETVKRTLPVKLTPEQLLQEQRHLAALTGRYDHVEERKKKIGAKFTAKLKDIRKEMSAAGKACKTGIKEELVECREFPDGRLVRLDTGEVVIRTPPPPQAAFAFEQVEDLLLEESLEVERTGDTVTIQLGTSGSPDAPGYPSFTTSGPSN